MISEIIPFQLTLLNILNRRIVPMSTKIIKKITANISIIIIKHFRKLMVIEMIPSQVSNKTSPPGRQETLAPPSLVKKAPNRYHSHPEK